MDISAHSIRLPDKASSRAIVSIGPPGGNGTIILIGLSG
jgi:hypothetical protein